MIYREFAGDRLSLLGFGAMRLPVLADGKTVDEEQVCRMVRCAADHGVNYFDTAYAYHESMSEVVLGRALKQLPRESFRLATKYPGHQIAETYDVKAVFEEQLAKCGVDYFDYYLLHNVYEDSIGVYLDPRWGIVDYLVEQRKAGRIRHLGFSCHGLQDNLEMMVERYGDVLEFCQIQLNYLDWTLQKAKEKVEYLTSKGLDIWVMEPLRGGRLVNIGEEAAAKIDASEPGARPHEWAFRFLQGIPQVKMILSGMSSLEQMEDNCRIFEEYRPLSGEQTELLLDLAEGMKNSVPCTACRYCCAGCPMELDIPTLLSLYNEMRFAPGFNVSMTLDGFPEDKRPSACISCGACARTCPQKIHIPDCMMDFAAMVAKMPVWAETCREREEAARRAKGE